jgi:glucose uptake protein
MAKIKLWQEIDYSEYFHGKFGWHLVGIAGGVIWNIGMCLSIISGGKAGYAISFGLGNGGTLIAALWGILIWKEFKNASKSTWFLLGSMIAFFTTAIILIIISKT